MNSIIDELFYENISPSELFPWSKEHTKLSAEYVETTDRLRKILGHRQLKLFETVIQQALDLTCCETQSYFHVGFCLGARFMQEIMEFEIP